MSIFIAPKIKIGFQKRADCFTGKLAYISYFDEKGKFRKEVSWEGWRNKDIPVEEYDNKPISGFTLNKDVKRYSGDWFSSKRTLIRVHDPRGFEFEVTTENLIAILMHTDCLRRGLIGEFVYAWSGQELVLLPTNSEEYTKAIQYTAGLSKKVKSKELVVGGSYRTKRDGDVVYMGKLNWYEYNTKSYYRKGDRREKKVSVFTRDDGETFFYKNSLSFLAELNSEGAVSNYADLMDKFNAKIYANKIIKIEPRRVDFDPETELRGPEYYYYNNLCLKNEYFFIQRSDGVFVQTSIGIESERETIANNDGTYSYKHTFKHYRLNYENYHLNIADSNVKYVEKSESRNYYPRMLRPLEREYDLKDIQSLELYNLDIIFENGTKKTITKLTELTNPE